MQSDNKCQCPYAVECSLIYYFYEQYCTTLEWCLSSSRLFYDALPRLHLQHIVHQYRHRKVLKNRQSDKQGIPKQQRPTIPRLERETDHWETSVDHIIMISQHTRPWLHAIVEGFGGEFTWIFVRATQHVKPHKQMSIVILEKGVMDVMVRRRSKSDAVKKSVPRKSILRMNERQPVRIHTTKGHVGPNIAVYQIGGTI